MLEHRQLVLKEIEELKDEHSDLNEIIDSKESNTNFSEFTIQQFKKRKLYIKDRIELLESSLYPDIIA